MQWPGFAKKMLDLFSADYEFYFILGDFKVEFNRTYINAFCDSYSLKSFAEKPTSFKIHVR